jgi:Contractile injection system tube protein
MGSSPMVFNATNVASDKLVHAQLEILAPPASGTTGPPGLAIDHVDFQFNPESLSLAKSAKWAPQQSQGSSGTGSLQYQGPEPSSLELELFLDATDDQSDKVVRTVEKLFACCVPTQDSSQKKKPSPPWARFRWGGLTGFTAYLKSVKATYLLFTTSGLPIRAKVTVSLTEIGGQLPGQNPTSGALAARTEHLVVAGDTLPSIAFGEYGDPSLWRVVAQANRIDDPMRLPEGTTLLLPAADEISG